MTYYFGTVSNMYLPFFGLIHLGIIFITMLSVFLIFKYKDKIRSSDFIDKTICIIIILNQLIYNIGAIVTGNYDIQYHLPLQYCYIIGYIYCYMLWFKKEKLFDFLYYAVFFCTFSVIIFQDTSVAYDRYDFILLLISHHFLFISLFYTLFVKNYKVSRNGIIKMIVYSLIIYLVVFFINQLIGTNYIFSDKFPDFMYEIIGFLDNLPTILWILLVSIPLYFISIIPIIIKKKLKKEIV